MNLIFYIFLYITNINVCFHENILRIYSSRTANRCINTHIYICKISIIILYRVWFVYIIISKIISLPYNAYISSFDFVRTKVDNRAEQSGVDRPISWKLNGKAMKYKYSTQGSVLSYLSHLLIFFTRFHISTYTIFDSICFSANASLFLYNFMYIYIIFQ